MEKGPATHVVRIKHSTYNILQYNKRGSEPISDVLDRLLEEKQITEDYEKDGLAPICNMSRKELVMAIAPLINRHLIQE